MTADDPAHGPTPAAAFRVAVAAPGTAADGTAAADDPEPVRQVDPSRVTVRQIDPLQQHGVYLAWGVLALIAVFGAALLALVGVQELLSPPQEVVSATALVQQAVTRYAAASDAQTLQQVEALMGRVAEARRATRDFWTSFSQFLLLNLLLPVLTAILGYVFGAMKKDG